MYLYNNMDRYSKIIFWNDSNLPAVGMIPRHSPYVYEIIYNFSYYMGKGD